MTMHGALHPKIDVDRVYLSREIGGKRFISYEGCIMMEEKNLGWCVRNSVEPLIEGMKAEKTTEYNDIVNKNERSCGIIDIAILGDIRVGEKEKEKIERY